MALLIGCFPIQLDGYFMIYWGGGLWKKYYWL